MTIKIFKLDQKIFLCYHVAMGLHGHCFLVSYSVIGRKHEEAQPQLYDELGLVEKSHDIIFRDDFQTTFQFAKFACIL